MRTVRIAPPPSAVGADLRAALISWGRTDRVLGGVALLGCRPPGVPHPVDAVVVTAHTTIVVVSVDLPGPALRLEAPLAGRWRSDGWPLTGDGSSVNPAVPVLRHARTVGDVLRAAGHGEIRTVVAIGPYAGEITQPLHDAAEPVRLCYPQPDTLLAAVQELAGTAQPAPPRPAAEAARLIAAVAPGCTVPETAELIAEGFPETAPQQVVPPREPPQRAPHAVPRLPLPPPPQGGTRARRRSWAAPVAVALAVLLVTGTVLAIVLAGGDPAAAGLPRAAPPAQLVNGQRFRPEVSSRADACARHAYGDVQVALQRQPCVALLRGGFASTVDRRPAAVSVAELRFADTATAEAFLVAAQVPGSGGIDSLVAEGRRWPGGPRSFDGAAYLVRRHGSAVRFTAAVWVGSPTTGDDPALRRLAADAQQLRLRDR